MAFRKPGSASSRSAGKNKFKKATANFKMLQFGVTYLDENDGKADFKVRVLLSSDDAKNQPCVKDESNNVTEEYTREEAAELVAKALLMGRGITSYLFDNSDSWGGNARIDISGIELDESEPQPKPAKAAAKSGKRTYVEPVEEVDEDEETYEEDDLPY
jgi:hypothetical protein